MLTQDRVKELFNYNKETGLLERKQRNGRMSAGSSVGTKTYGYIQIQIDGVIHKAHRVIWLYVHGELPICDIDHINGIRDDNKISNLRLASRSDNMQNQRRSRLSNGTSQYLGVHKHSKINKFVSQIKVDGKVLHLGCFNTDVDAYNAYLLAKRKYHKFCTI